MSDYNENRSNCNNTSEVTYSPDTKTKCRKKTFILEKAVLGLLCVAAVSFGLICIYADLTGENSSELNEESVVTRVESEPEPVLNAEASASDLSKQPLRTTLTVPEIVKKAKPSVVGISSEFDSGVSTGTGIIISSDGYIVTNAHVVQDAESGTAVRAKNVTAVLSDSTECSASIIGADSRTDLAVVKISSDGLTLTPADFGDSDKLTEGELAVAIGNPLGFELYGSTTCGIISALNRKITVGEYEMTLIQTDAAINPGNSGGPLLNSMGQVVGINSSKIISDYAEGLGFAIPISSAQPIITDLIDNGYVTGRPMLGISGEDIGDITARYYNLPEGVCVRFITPDSAAEQSGIKVGDIIVGIDGVSIATMEQLNEQLDLFSAGDTVALSIYRSDSGTQFELNLTLDENKE